MYDVDAIALQYGFYNHFNKKEENRVVFVEIGYLHATVFAVHYHHEGMRLLYCQPVEGCSGRDFDHVMVDLVYEKLQPELERLGLSERMLSPRDRMSIFAGCEKVKPYFGEKGLTELDVKVSIQSHDLAIPLTRQEFDDRAKKLVIRLKKAGRRCFEKLVQSINTITPSTLCSTLSASDENYKIVMVDYHSSISSISSSFPVSSSSSSTTTTTSPSSLVSAIVLEGPSTRLYCVHHAMKELARERMRAEGLISRMRSSQGSLRLSSRETSPSLPSLTSSIASVTSMGDDSPKPLSPSSITSPPPLLSASRKRIEVMYAIDIY